MFSSYMIEDVLAEIFHLCEQEHQCDPGGDFISSYRGMPSQAQHSLCSSPPLELWPSLDPGNEQRRVWDTHVGTISCSRSSAPHSWTISSSAMTLLFTMHIVCILSLHCWLVYKHSAYRVYDENPYARCETVHATYYRCLLCSVPLLSPEALAKRGFVSTGAAAPAVRQVAKLFEARRARCGTGMLRPESKFTHLMLSSFRKREQNPILNCTCKEIGPWSQYPIQAKQISVMSFPRKRKRDPALSRHMHG